MHSSSSYHLTFIFWTVSTIAINLIRLPLLAIYYLPQKTRPHPKWTYHQAIGVEILRIWFKYASTVRFRFPLSLDPGTEGDRFVVMQPSTNDDFYDVLSKISDTDIKPEPVGGTWYPSLYNACDDAGKRVVLHFHGGGYVLGGTRDSECRSAALKSCRNLNALAFFARYRLASSQKGRFPAALQDALTAYAYLIGLGVRNKDIVLSGDSAGGHLVIMQLRCSSENPGLFDGEPRAAMLWSPWLNLAVKPEELDCNRNSTADFVLGVFVKWAV
ncbi:MAG: hypothetical protein Q9169_002360 [Polycauliona sp. 2 TL-2023]